MTITADDVRRLLASDENATLVLIAGRVEVLPSGERDDEHRGALEIISRSDLVARIGHAEPSDHELEEVAGGLDATVTDLGA